MKRVVIVKDKGPGATYDMNKVGTDTEVLYYASWEPVAGDPFKRALVDHLSAVTPGSQRYLNGQGGTGGTVSVNILLSFSKPMRTASSGPGPSKLDLSGVADFSGVLSTLDSWLTRSSSVSWLSKTRLFQEANQQITLGPLRYDFDTWIATIAVPTSVPAGAPSGTGIKNARLLVEAKDQVSLKLDANPATVVTYQSGSFAKYEDHTAQAATSDNDGGTDDNHGTFYIDTVRPTLRKSP